MSVAGLVKKISKAVREEADTFLAANVRKAESPLSGVWHLHAEGKEYLLILQGTDLAPVESDTE